MAAVNFTDKQKAKMVELYVKHGLTTYAIAERFSVRQPAVAKILKDQGIETKHPGQSNFIARARK